MQGVTVHYQPTGMVPTPLGSTGHAEPGVDVAQPSQAALGSVPVTGQGPGRLDFDKAHLAVDQSAEDFVRYNSL